MDRYPLPWYLTVVLLSPGHRVSFDSNEIGRLFQSHGPMVYGRARKLLGSHADAEEATQDIFVKIMTGTDRPSSSRELVLWLSRITTNYCLNIIRDSRRRREIAREKMPFAPDNVSSREPDLLVDARALLAQATEREAEAAIYVFIDGMTHKEAAMMLDVSTRTVGNLLARFTAAAQDAAVPADKRRTGGAS
jgi:RNA polymerase sigma factor (sigma-70 family)